MDKQIELTRAALEEKKARLSELRSKGRDDIAKRIAEARSQGDLSENAEYDAAMNDQAHMEAEIRELEYIVDHAIIIDETNLSLDKISLGLSAKVKDLTFGEECEFHFVSSPDVNPFENKISDDSPVGKALVGHRAGDIVEAETPGGIVKLEILKIFKS